VSGKLKIFTPPTGDFPFSIFIFACGGVDQRRIAVLLSRQTVNHL
jgi:hypothetical protein